MSSYLSRVIYWRQEDTGWPVLALPMPKLAHCIYIDKVTLMNNEYVQLMRKETSSFR